MKDINLSIFPAITAKNNVGGRIVGNKKQKNITFKINIDMSDIFYLLMK